jgi:hypothetical protein
MITLWGGCVGSAGRTEALSCFGKVRTDFLKAHAGIAKFVW